MKTEWVEQALKLARTEADFYSGCRKILQARRITFTGFHDEGEDAIQIEDSGFTKSKMTMLRKNYLHAESKAVAVELWTKRRGQAKYGSVGFTCYAHFVKGGSIDAKRSKRASVFGPCIQSVTLTWVSKTELDVDIFYRTTEWLKKFPADLVFLRDELLAGFDLKGMKVRKVNCHFANITIHPMYFVTVLPHIEDPIRELERIKKADKYFYDWLIKWSARYICDEYMRGIAKFAQAMRVRKDALERISPKMLKTLQKYFRDNHPGYRGDYVDPDEED